MAAKTPCIIHGCPGLVDAGVPNLYYCEEHDHLHADHLDELNEDWARGILMDAIERAAEDQVFAEGRPEPEYVFLRNVASRMGAYAPAVLEAVDGGRIWEAVLHALMVGRYAGHEEHVAHLLEIREMRPLAEWARKAREGHRKRSEAGAAKRRGATKADREQVRAEVDALRAKYPKMSRTEACEHVAPLHGIHPRTARRYTE